MVGGDRRGRSRRGQALAAIALGSFAREAIAQPQQGDCLNANAGPSIPFENCSADPVRLAAEPKIRAAMKLYGIAADQLVFVGCEKGRFSTSQPRRNAQGLVFQINYPTSRGPLADIYLAPIIHELGHVLQIQTAGGIPAARAAHQNSSERIELGADYLSGIVLRRVSQASGRAGYQRGGELVGSYRSATADFHGSPEQRLAAFRMGFYLERSIPLTTAETEFQDDGYGRVKSMTAP